MKKESGEIEPWKADGSGVVVWHNLVHKNIGGGEKHSEKPDGEDDEPDVVLGQARTQRGEDDPMSLVADGQVSPNRSG